MSSSAPVLAGLALSACFLLFTVGYRQMRSQPLEHLAVEDLVLLRGQSRREAEGVGPLERLAGLLVPRLRRVLGPARLRAIQRRIDEAGRPDGITLDGFLRRTAWWMLLTFPLGVLFLLQGNVFGLLLSLVVPVLLPFSRLAAAQRRRQERIDTDLPDFMDVLAVTVGAGVAFRPALARVSERFPGPLGAEIQLALGQLANGASLRQAFEDLRERNRSSEATAQFVTAFLQSEELGAPLVDTLHQIALDMRRDNAQRLRTKAARTAPRVTLVTSLVFVPGALVLLVSGLIIGSEVDFGALFGGGVTP